VPGLRSHPWHQQSTTLAHTIQTVPLLLPPAAASSSGERLRLCVCLALQQLLAEQQQQEGWRRLPARLAPAVSCTHLGHPLRQTCR
jgi:hypothetical protein